MRLLASLAAAAVLLLGPAHAQVPAPAYLAEEEAYAQAMERRDYAAAEVAASAALSAYESAHGEDARSARLTFNLADARLRLERQADALAPARRAVALVDRYGADTYVDPFAARFAVARAELVVAPGAAAEANMFALLEQARGGRPDIGRYAHPAAMWLADSAFKGERYGAALRATEFAEHYAERAEDAPLALSRALLFRGAAQMYLNAHADAYVSFVRAQVAVRELTEPESEEMTDAERAYAQALAWRYVTYSFMRYRGEVAPDVSEYTAGGGMPVAVAAGEATPCPVRLAAVAIPRFPRLRDYRYRNGAVVARISTNEAGEITRREIAAVLPTGEFAEMVERVYGRWRVVRGDDAPEGCTMARRNIMVVVSYAP